MAGTELEAFVCNAEGKELGICGGCHGFVVEHNGTGQKIEGKAEWQRRGAADFLFAVVRTGSED